MTLVVGGNINGHEALLFSWTTIMTDIEQRIKQAVWDLHAQGIYPSSAQVSEYIGRKNPTLAKHENDYRKQIMKQLGIEVRKHVSNFYSEDWGGLTQW